MTQNLTILWTLFAARVTQLALDSDSGVWDATQIIRRRNSGVICRGILRRGQCQAGHRYDSDLGWWEIHSRIKFASRYGQGIHGRDARATRRRGNQDRRKARARKRKSMIFPS